MAYVHPEADLATSVEVGPFCNVQAGVVLGEGCKLDSHVTIHTNSIIGRDCVFSHGAVIGGDPQDRKYHGEATYLRVGDRNTFREYVTVHRASGEGMATVVGNDCYLMAYCHLGHNACLMDSVTMANSVGISGHATVEQNVTIGGMTGIHQFARIGKFAMVGGLTRVSMDVPPFMIVAGDDQQVHDINAVGLRRMGIESDARLALHKACKLLYKSQLGTTNAIETIRREVPSTPEVEYLIAFELRRMKGKNGRGDQP
jgi:UDP-N-acetylglucosamine acyltransferase